MISANSGRRRTGWTKRPRYLREAILILERTTGPRSLETLKTLGSLAAVAFRLGRHEQAEWCSARELETAEQGFAEMPGLLARVLFLRAEGLKTTGRKREGKALERRAKALSNADALLSGASYVVDASALKPMSESGRYTGSLCSQIIHDRQRSTACVANKRRRRSESKGDGMYKKLTWVVLLGAVIGVAVLYTGNAWATPAIGFMSTTVAMGRFDEIDAFNNMVSSQGPEEQHGSNVWLSLQKTKGQSDLYVQSNVWQPGGTSGWHTHPGHSLITVTAGTVTAYEADDPDCKPKVYTQGMGFVDPGDGHVHNLRNEGSVEARTITVQLLPAGAPRRIDSEGPQQCSF